VLAGASFQSSGFDHFQVDNSMPPGATSTRMCDPQCLVPASSAPQPTNAKKASRPLRMDPNLTVEVHNRVGHNRELDIIAQSNSSTITGRRAIPHVWGVASPTGRKLTPDNRHGELQIRPEWPTSIERR
jgi:hypothetical protein